MLLSATDKCYFCVRFSHHYENNTNNLGKNQVLTNGAMEVAVVVRLFGTPQEIRYRHERLLSTACVEKV